MFAGPSAAAGQATAVNAHGAGEFAFRRSPVRCNDGAADRLEGLMQPPPPQQQQQGSTAGSGAANAGNHTGLLSSDNGSAVGGIGAEQQQLQLLSWGGRMPGNRTRPGVTPPAPRCTPVAQPAGGDANRFISPWAARQQDGKQQLLSPASSSSSLARFQARQQHLGELRVALRAGLPALLVPAEVPGCAVVHSAAWPAAADAHTQPAVPHGVAAADRLPAGPVGAQHGGLSAGEHFRDSVFADA